MVFQFFRALVMKASRFINFMFLGVNSKKNITDKDFLRASTRRFNSVHELINNLRLESDQNFFIECTRREEVLVALNRISHSAKNEIINEANTICDHVIDLLGSKPTFLGEKINWHKDFKSNYQFPDNKLYFKIQPAKYPGGFDIKVPWELSRFQHLTRIGQAYWITLDEKYAIEFKNQIEDWIKNNPYPYGVNWSSTMEVAIRAVNWFWGIAFFKQSKSLDNGFYQVFYKSLILHARHIWKNLEWHFRLTTNHYIANLVGLLYCGLLLPELKESSKWYKFALKEMEIEIEKQVYPDGMDFEGSIGYHRFVTELFLSATILAENHGHTFSPIFYDHLTKMIDNISKLTRQDGSVPLIGDQDNGRLHRLKTWNPKDKEWNDFRHILAIGAVWKANLRWASEAMDCLDEAVWFFGSQVGNLQDQVRKESSICNRGSLGLQNSGIYMLQDNDFQVTVNAGYLGQKGFGGHSHNDSLSFDLFLMGQPIIVDAGTNVYTYNYLDRNEYRSSKKHNLVTIEDIEDDFFDRTNLFQRENRATITIPLFSYKDETSLLIGQNIIFSPQEVIRRRGFLLDSPNNYLLISDFVNDIPGTRQMKLLFSPGVEISKESLRGYSGLSIITNKGTRVMLISLTSPHEQILISKDFISPSYGAILPCWSALFRWSLNVNHSIAVIPESQNYDFPHVIEKALEEKKILDKAIRDL